MEALKYTSERTTALKQLRFLKGNLALLFLWPLFCLLVCGVMWVLLQSYLTDEKEGTRKEGVREVVALAKSYSEQLARTIAQIDQVTLNLGYYWKQSNRTLKLSEQFGLGLYPDDPNFSAAITDRNGLIISSLLPLPGRVSVAKRPYFVTQKSQPFTGLQFGQIAVGRITGRPNLVFSRRINDNHGNFDGVVVVGLSPAFLTSYYFTVKGAGEASLTLLGKGGNVIAPGLDASIWARDSHTVRATTFRPDTGNAVFPATCFSDRRSRVVAWEGLSNYPFVAVAALPENELYATYQESRRRYLGIASIASLLLAIAGVTGLAAGGRLAWRKYQASVIADTYRLATDGACEGFLMARALYSTDHVITDFVIEHCNEQGAQMVGMTRDGLLSMRFSTLFQGRRLRELMAIFSEVMRTGFIEDEYRTRRANATTWTNRRLVRSGDGIAITLRDISQEKSQEQALHALVNSDTLTALPNRYCLSQKLPSVLDAARKQGMKAALLYLDLDDFKNVNNTLGHEVGDSVLCEAGRRIQCLLRPSDYVGRLGGDEFAIILSSILASDEAVAVATRILHALSEPMKANGCRVASIRASVGISIFPEDGSEFQSLLRHADIAMYTAKSAGKGHHAFYSPSQTEQIVKRLNDEAALREAVDKGQFILYYQPRVDAVTGHLVGMEALVRWLHPERGLVPPLEFIPLAEETGLITHIGEFVIDQACAQIARWRGFSARPLTVSVNVSPIQFERGNIKSTIETAAARHGISAALLEIEITESCMMLDSERVFADIAAIKSLGVRVSVDDFGTGYSSLSQLQKMDLDILKVDRAFTMELTNGKNGEAFFKTIISMAHTLKMKVVAEGVETLRQLTTLQALGCDEIQGYYVSRPVAAETMTELMNAGCLFPIAREAHETFHLVSRTP